LALRLEDVENINAKRRTDQAAHQQHRAHPEVHRLSLEMGEHAGKGRGDNLVRFGRYGHRGRDADEEEQRRHQEPAADAEHARQNPHKSAKAQQQKGIHRYFGNGEVDLHGFP